jgi:signal transduction histidine kinase
MLAVMVLAYVLAGWALTLLCRWRERDWRMLFVIRREAEQLAEELRAQNEVLLGLNQQRDDFVAGVLHDLRSPVTGVLLTADLLRNESAIAPAARDSLLDEMTRSARRIDEFASQFLEQRALERAAEKLRPVAVPLAPVVERAVERARLTARHKSQHIILDVTNAAPAHVAADELLLDRALGNLLDNAVKYSPRGGTITVHTIETATEVRVAVRDSGHGLSAEDRAKLFQPYARLSQKPTGGEFSTGLGLSLVKSWIEAMGGTVGCDSEGGHGATFWLALPRRELV